jgi:hypothetical protein
LADTVVLQGKDVELAFLSHLLLAIRQFVRYSDECLYRQVRHSSLTPLFQLPKYLMRAQPRDRQPDYTESEHQLFVEFEQSKAETQS